MFQIIKPLMKALNQNIKNEIQIESDQLDKKNEIKSFWRL